MRADIEVHESSNNISSIEQNKLLTDRNFARVFGQNYSQLKIFLDRISLINNVLGFLRMKIIRMERTTFQFHTMSTNGLLFM